jgi:hypothetical protein
VLILLMNVNAADERDAGCGEVLVPKIRTLYGSEMSLKYKTSTLLMN